MCMTSHLLVKVKVSGGNGFSGHVVGLGDYLFVFVFFIFLAKKVYLLKLIIDGSKILRKLIKQNKTSGSWDNVEA